MWQQQWSKLLSLWIVTNLMYIFSISNRIAIVSGFSTPNPSSSSGNDASYTLFDRFQAKCPADLGSIRQFDARLVDDDCEDETAWVAVYRSSNNLPSVLIKDDFLNAMRIATTSVETSANSSTIVENEAISSSFEESVSARIPVAIAKISKTQRGSWILDSMRCSLKKEDQNDACDGGSEHVEALSVCVDELLLYYLSSTNPPPNFLKEGAIRCKATLVSSAILEDRGFKEITKIEKDMATHVSSFQGVMQHYADRAVTTVAKNPGARDRALKILSLLARLEEQDEEIETSTPTEQQTDDEDDEYDPWASVKQFYTG